MRNKTSVALFCRQLERGASCSKWGKFEFGDLLPAALVGRVEFIINAIEPHFHQIYELLILPISLDKKSA
jgi:hypothetical protein